MTRNRSVKTRRSRTFLTLYYWGKLLGINSSTLLPNNKVKFSYFGLFYACFLSVTYIYGLYCFVNERRMVLLPDETPSSIVTDYSEIMNVGLEVLLTWLVNGFFQNRVNLIVESFFKAEEISSDLEIPEDYEQHFKQLGFYLILGNSVWFFLVVWNDIELLRFPNFRPIVWSGYNLLRLPPFNSVLTALWSFLLVKRKFHRLNEKIRFLMLHDNGKCWVLEENVSSGLIENFRYNPTVLSDAIDLISWQRRRLIELISVIKRYFDPLLLLCIMAHVSNGLTNGYLLYRSVNRTKPMDARDWLFTCSYVAWFSFPILALTVISNVCGSTINEANETGNILHGMLNNYENLADSREIAKLTMFSFDLLKNPLKISLFGLVDLDHWTIYKIVIAASMYIIIMLQFYN